MSVPAGAASRKNRIVCPFCERGGIDLLGDEGEKCVRAAYPGKTWDRLAEIKGRYDPTNLFRLNQNVPPAVGNPND